jgi:glycosyltransferase involved in cell wall biosynthesis
MFQPKVSIVIPVFNGSNYLGEAIDSALTQTYGNMEIIVINDGSSDNGKTRGIALSYGDKIRYYEKENGGVATALNYGIRKMTGDYFSWLSHDDLYYPDKIKSQIEYLKKFDDKKVILYSDYDVIDEKSELKSTVRMPDTDPADFRRWILLENVLHGCTLLIPVECFKTHGFFNEKLLTTQDYSLWFNFAGTYDFLRIPLVLVKSRQHNEQTTKKLDSIVIEECNLLLIHFFKALEISDYRLLLKTGNSLYKRKYYLAAYCVFSNNNISSFYLLNRRIIFMIKKMKSLFKIITRNPFLFPYLVNGTYNNVDTKKRFTLYYKRNTFGSKESKSGEGSTLTQTEKIRPVLPRLFKDYGIEIMIDAPCGDFNWMRHVNMDNIKRYYGIDIVDDIIIKNKKKYGDDKFKFLCLDILNDGLPEGDLLLCRDCLCI